MRWMERNCVKRGVLKDAFVLLVNTYSMESVWNLNFVQVDMYVCTYVCMYVCTYACVYLRMYVYICMHVCMYPSKNQHSWSAFSMAI